MLRSVQGVTAQPCHLSVGFNTLEQLLRLAAAAHVMAARSTTDRTSSQKRNEEFSSSIRIDHNYGHHSTLV
jgi:hypothetical protein